MEYNEFSKKWEVDGSFPDLINTLALVMNFTYTLERPPDNAWGIKNSNGEWNGIMHLVINDIKDFGKRQYRNFNGVIVFQFGIVYKSRGQKIDTKMNLKGT